MTESTVQTISILDSFKEKALDAVMKYGSKLIIALLIILIGFKIVKVITKKIENSKSSKKLEPTAKSFIQSILSVALKIIIVVLAAAVMGIPMASIVALVGSAGLAIGLAMQGSLSNIAGGFIIFICKPFVVGDSIKAGDFVGTVESISVFYTKILTPDNNVIVVPNGMISNQSLTDMSAKDTRRVELDFKLTNDNDVETVKNLLVKVAAESELSINEPKPVASLILNDGASQTYTLKAWCKTGDFASLQSYLIENVKKSFDENGIKFA